MDMSKVLSTMKERFCLPSTGWAVMSLPSTPIRTNSRSSTKACSWAARGIVPGGRCLTFNTNGDLVSRRRHRLRFTTYQQPQLCPLKGWCWWWSLQGELDGRTPNWGRRGWAGWGSSCCVCPSASFVWPQQAADMKMNVPVVHVITSLFEQLLTKHSPVERWSWPSHSRASSAARPVPAWTFWCRSEPECNWLWWLKSGSRMILTSLWHSAAETAVSGNTYRQKSHLSKENLLTTDAEKKKQRLKIVCYIRGK